MNLLESWQSTHNEILHRVASRLQRDITSLTSVESALLSEPYAAYLAAPSLPTHGQTPPEVLQRIVKITGFVENHPANKSALDKYVQYHRNGS